MYKFVPNKSIGSLLQIEPTSSIFLKTFNLELPYNEIWFRDQNSQPLEIKDRINLPLIIN